MPLGMCELKRKGKAPLSDRILNFLVKCPARRDELVRFSKSNKDETLRVPSYHLFRALRWRAGPLLSLPDRPAQKRSAQLNLNLEKWTVPSLRPSQKPQRQMGSPPEPCRVSLFSIKAELRFLCSPWALARAVNLQDLASVC